jgi:N-acylneuraminate cytidylyltransferase
VKVKKKKLPAPSISTLLRHLKGIVFDFDGVMTDNRVIVHADGSESVMCNRSDGMGVDRLRAIGMKMIILSKERNPICHRRAEKLKIECENAIDDKLSRLREFASRNGLALGEIAYLGNDINDLECMRHVGLSVAVADAWPAVKKQARLVLTMNGGCGAVREFSDRVIAAKGIKL